MKWTDILDMFLGSVKPDGRMLEKYKLRKDTYSTKVEKKTNM